MEDTQQFSHKALDSPPDDRDWMAENMRPKKSKLPPSIDLRKDMMPIRNQGIRGTCVAFAGAALKEWQEFKDNGFKDYMSPEFIYWHRVNKPDEGMYVRDLLKILTGRGCCPEYIFPYNVLKDAEKIPGDSQIIAKEYRVKSYARIQTIDGLKTALAIDGPCLISLDVYSEIRPKFWRKPREDAKKLGGHAVAVVGYNDKGFILRNSWGVLWNLNGYVTFPYGDFDQAKEIWTTIDIKGSKKPEPGCSFFSCRGRLFS